nr:PREDICTED: uncharacterized protein LOC103315149 isoform X2 [Tribolium castaneum]|eukprot:XP_015840673.1 PREDICTED: uncharacterized protein LOC103315149 isoform X2 [Tribolium castaneum]
MTQYFHSIFNLRIGWFILVVINFIFGICGIITCTLKLKHGSEQARDDFFKLSIVFATCNLILSVLLLVSVIKNNQKYAFLCAFLSFLSLFSAVIHVEIGTTSNVTFIIVFVVVGKLDVRQFFSYYNLGSILGALFLFWFCIYASYQVLYQRKQEMEQAYMSPIWYFIITNKKYDTSFFRTTSVLQ